MTTSWQTLRRITKPRLNWPLITLRRTSNSAGFTYSSTTIQRPKLSIPKLRAWILTIRKVTWNWLNFIPRARNGVRPKTNCGQQLRWIHHLRNTGESWLRCSIAATRSGRPRSNCVQAAGLAPGDAKLHLALANFLATVPNERASADEEYARVKELDPTLVPESATPAESSAATPALASTPPPPAPPAAMTAPKPLKPLHRRFLLTHNSPVYQNANSSSGVVAQVHRRKWVRVTGISGDWLQVTLRDGTVGFIPTSAAE